MCTWSDYLQLALLREFHGGFGYTHILGKIPSGLNLGMGNGSLHASHSAALIVQINPYRKRSVGYAYTVTLNFQDLHDLIDLDMLLIKGRVLEKYPSPA